MSGNRPNYTLKIRPVSCSPIVRSARPIPRPRAGHRRTGICILRQGTGGTRLDLGGPGGNDYILPEGRLLKPEQVRQYSRPGDHHPAAGAVLAVWPIGGGVVEGFHVALVTANPSLLYRLAKAFD